MTDKEPDKKKSKKPMALSVKFALFSVFVAAAVFFPTTIVFLACMVPTFVAAIVDREPQKTMWITIGALNLAGMMPAWFELWSQGHSLDTALSVLTQPVMLFMAYGGAGAGWVIYYQVTPVIAGMMVRKNLKRLKEIEKRQKELVKKWGDDVVQNA